MTPGQARQESVRIGIFQCAAGGLSLDARLEGLRDAVARAQTGADRGLDLVLCPELFASGYNLPDELASRAEPATGAIFARFAELATELDSAIVYGYPERGDGCIHNAAAFVSADGELLANHRKQLNSPGSFEEACFAPGERTTVLSWRGLEIAILICYEVEFPEAVRCAAVAGAELVLVPTALTDQWGVVADCVVPARAFENGVWLAYANHAGHENGLDYLGGSKIVGPDGRIEAAAGADEALISTAIDPRRVEAAPRRLPYLRDFGRYRCDS